MDKMSSYISQCFGAYILNLKKKKKKKKKGEKKRAQYEEEGQGPVRI